MKCIRCGGNHVVKAGYKKLSSGEIQKYKCQDCKRFFTGEEKFNKLSDEKKGLIAKIYEEKGEQKKIARILGIH